MKKTVAMGACALLSLAVGAFEIEQVFRPERFSRGDTNNSRQQAIDEASWVWMPGLNVWGGAIFTETRPDGLDRVPSYFVKFRRDFVAIGNEPLAFDVSADERYVLLLDGREISRGPHRGLANRWNYQSYRITSLAAGSHRLEAVCWQLGEHAPLSQLSLRGGFILKAAGAYDALLTTGKADWQAGRLVNTRMTHKANGLTFGVGSCCEVTGTSFLDEEPAQWTSVQVVRGPIKTFAGLLVQGWLLFPTVLHDMMFEVKRPGKIVRGLDVLAPDKVVPPHAKVEALWDLENYYCAYPFVRVSGGKGARIVWKWTESLTNAKGEKKDRSEWKGLDVYKLDGDAFVSDGRAEARFTTPWWRCGRWCKLEITTAEEPLTIREVSFAETRAPVEMRAQFDCDDPFVKSVQPICARVLQMCMHEHFFDCPYYEQQMYPGDSRVQYLVSGLFDTEDRLVRNAMTIYDSDRRENGMTSFNCPTRGTQEGLGFVCCELMMFGDYAWQHTHRAWLKERAAGMNHTLMGLESFTRADGLLARTPGWNFVDWVTSWGNGVPPEGDSEKPNAEINLQYLMALKSAIKTEEALGEMTLAEHWRGRAERLARAIKAEFWCPDRSLFASSGERKNFSEHAQCLALLADVVTGDEAKACFDALITADLDRTTIYYKHYLFETFFKFGRSDLFFKNLGFWKDCLKWGLSTVLETPQIDSRSDCHGWGSHPLWHLHTGVAGVRSAAPWYAKVLVEPQPAHLKFIRSRTPTPRGDVVLDLRFDGDKVSGTVETPKDLTGIFRWKGREITLPGGVCDVAQTAQPYVWRGLMLDCSRHFFTVAEIKKTLDAMQTQNLNVFHWHLIDGNGWRLQIDRYPLLTQRGAVRTSYVGPVRKTPYMHDSFETSPGKYGPYFYTKDQVREIVRYAAERGIRVVPEVEIPGHEGAATGCYPFLRCPKGGNEICIGSDEAITFLERVLDEVVELFPDEVVHIGGDECNADAWRACPKCQARLKALGSDDVHQLRYWVTRHVAEYLAKKGRRIMGWSDIYGGPGLPKSAIIQEWNNREVAKRAAADGHDIVYSMATEAYLDFDQGLKDDLHEYPCFAGRLPCKEVYRGFDPVRDVAPEHRSHVLGGEGCAWTENIADQAELEFKVWPRMIVMADLLYRPVPMEARDWKAYLPRLQAKRERLVASGVGAAPLGPVTDGIPPGLDPKPRRVSAWFGGTCPVLGPKITASAPQLKFVKDAKVRPGGYAVTMTWQQVTIRHADDAGRDRALERLNKMAIPKDGGRVLYIPNVEIED